MSNDGNMLSIATERFEDAVAIVLGGELTAETAPMLHGAVYDSLEAGARSVDIHMAAVTFIDSGGLSALLGVRARLQVAEVPMTVSAPSPTVQRVFESTQLTKVFDVTADHERSESPSHQRPDAGA